MQIACVLRSGGEYNAHHVCLLADSILAHNNVPIVCLSDVNFYHPGVEVRPLLHKWQGWWSKIELFREFTGPTLYLDLDTVVIGRLPAIGKKFTMLRDVYRSNDFGSGVMSWASSHAWLYENFLRQPSYYINRYRTRRNWGDQGYMRDYLGHVPELFGDEYRSYKVHCAERVPAGTSVVYFHGKPKPWEVELCLS